MTNAKYSIEPSLSFCCKQLVTIPPKYLTSDDNIDFFKNSNFHHYMIVKSPRVFFKEITIEGTDLNYTFISKFKGKDFIYQITLEDQLDNNIKPIFKYNTTKTFVQIYDDSENLISEVDANLLFQKLCIDTFIPEEYLPEWEILYIGKAYGQNGERTSLTRLKSHSTLQRILAEHFDNSSFEEIKIIALEFEKDTTFLNIQGFLNGDTPQIDIEKSFKHIEDIKKKGVSELQKVNMIEAAMIKWFEPEYNDQLKNDFSNKELKSISEAYDLDLNNLLFSITTFNNGFKLYSKKREASMFHIGHIPLQSHDKRKDIFYFLNDEK